MIRSKLNRKILIVYINGYGVPKGDYTKDQNLVRYINSILNFLDGMLDDVADIIIYFVGGATNPFRRHRTEAEVLRGIMVANPAFTMFNRRGVHIDLICLQDPLDGWEAVQDFATALDRAGIADATVVMFCEDARRWRFRYIVSRMTKSRTYTVIPIDFDAGRTIMQWPVRMLEVVSAILSWNFPWFRDVERRRRLRKIGRS